MPTTTNKRTHPLGLFLERRKLTQSEFARIAGVDRPALNRLLNGKGRLPIADALAVGLATDGEVTLRDCIAFWTEHAPRRRRDAGKTRKAVRR
jgi:transcriptional regulator with XRE-family HTH domain